MRRRDVIIPREAFVEGDLSRICVASGEPADGLVDFRIRTTPLWTWILLPFGVIPFIVAALVTTETTHGSLPVNREVVDRFHRRRRWMVGAVAAGLFALVAGAFAASRELALLGLGLLAPRSCA